MAKRFALVSVRESASAEALRSAGVQCRVVPDLALWHRHEASGPRSGVGYSDSVVAEDALGIYGRMRRADGIAISILRGRRTLYDFAISVRRFLPRGTIPTPGRLVAAVRGAVTDWCAQIPDRDSFAAALVSRKLIVTGRFHMVIFCLLTRTPFLAVESNTHKISATLRDAQLREDRLVKPSALVEPVLAAADFDDQERLALDRFVEQGRAAIDRLFADLAVLQRGARDAT